MNRQPLISVIIPAHNYAAYLPASIGSVTGQTYSNIEILVIDDASEDNTKEIVNKLSATDPRISYHYQEKSGPTVARNRGIKLAKGEFIQFLDADDFLEKEKFEKQIQVFSEHPENDIVYGGVNYFHNDRPGDFFNNLELKPGKTWMPCVSGMGDEMVMALLKENIMVISSPLVRKSLFDKYGAMDESLLFNEDWELWLRFAINNAVFYFADIPSTNALIRVHTSYSRDNFKMFVFGLKVCLEAAKKLTSYSFRKILVPKINYHIKVIDQKLLSMQKEDSRKAENQAELVYKTCGLEKYKRYSRHFMHRPVWLNSLLLKSGAVFRKSKSILMYGA
ncbi:MAG: glycosyltransferase family 2 protein [Bacteroidota bacterium]